MIEKLLKDPVPAVRESAAAALADLGAKESAPVLAQGLNDGSYTVRAAVAAALLQLGQSYETVDSTIRALAQQNDTAARTSAAFALGKATKANRQEAMAVLGSLAVIHCQVPRSWRFVLWVISAVERSSRTSKKPCTIKMKPCVPRRAAHYCMSCRR